LRTLLESLARYEPIAQFQLLVTDNLRTDLAEIRPSGWHSVEVLRPERPLGYAANHNAAFRRCEGAFFCVLNPDVVFRQPVLLQLIRRIDQRQGDMAAPVLVDSLGVVQDSFRGMPTPWELVGRRLILGGPVADPVSAALLHPDWIAGTFMLLRRATFERLGGFDTRYRLYFEDVDLCTRARLLGLVILVDAGLRLIHNPHRESRRPGRHLLWHIGSALRFFMSDPYRRAKALPSHA
jgi:GT2 family glycosyltransferase